MLSIIEAVYAFAVVADLSVRKTFTITVREIIWSFGADLTWYFT